MQKCTHYTVISRSNCKRIDNILSHSLKRSDGHPTIRTGNTSYVHNYFHYINRIIYMSKELEIRNGFLGSHIMILMINVTFMTSSAFVSHDVD